MQFSKREKGGRRGLAWLETAAALTVPAPAPEGAALRSSLRAAVEQLVHSLAQLSRAEGSTGSALYLCVPAEGLHLEGLHLCRDAMYEGERRKGREATHYKDLFLFFFFKAKSERSTVLCPPVPCWGVGLWGCGHPRGCRLMTVWARGAEARLLAGPSRRREASGPGRAAGRQNGQPHPVPWDRVKVVSALPGPQYPGPLLFKVERLHFPNNQNCEELTRGAGWRLFHSWFVSPPQELHSSF